MRSVEVHQIDSYRCFRSDHDTKAVESFFVDCGFFPRGLLTPIYEHLIGVGRVQAINTHPSFSKFAIHKYFFNGHPTWCDDGGIDAGYYMDLNGNSIFFQLNLAAEIDDRVSLQFGMENRATVPKKLKNYIVKLRRRVKRVNENMDRVTAEFYKLPIGVAYQAQAEFSVFYKAVSKMLSDCDYGYTDLHKEESYFLREIDGPVGTVFFKYSTCSLGKIWLRHKSYARGEHRPGPIILDIMFEDKDVESLVLALANETLKCIAVNDKNIVECEQEQIVRKLNGNAEEIKYKLPEIDGFEYNV